jgi:serine/threonine-protein kinase
VSENPTVDGRTPAREAGKIDVHRETVHAPSAGSPVPLDQDGPASGEHATFSSWIGRTIDDRYRIEALLGEGGMGAVMLAEHLKLQKKVALKVILPQFAGVGELAERFAREAMASAKLDHPHIASALDYGTLAEGGAYLVMQLVRGKSLRDAMEERTRDWAFACEVGAQIADALSAAHALRIVHRDLKPENVMLESRAEGSETVHVRVLDFGVARVVGDEAAEGPGTRKLTRVGTILGTPGYMAPEQALGEAVDERADLYALGVLLWECIVGRELFAGGDISTILTAQLTQPIDPITLHVQGVPPELDALVFRLLAPRRDDRPAKAAEVRDALRKLALTRQLERVSGSGQFTLERPSSLGAVPALPAGALAAERAASTASSPKLPLASLFPPAARSRGVYIGFVGAAALTLVVVGVGLGLAFSGGDDPVPVPVPVPLTNAPTTIGPPPTAPFVAPTTPTTPTSSHPALPTTTPTTPTASGATGPPMTPEIARDLAILIESDSRDTRLTAAESLLARPAGTLPPLVDALARLETAEGCNSKRNALRGIRELRDPLALPAVERLDRLPRRGCGMFNMGDCWTCLRPEVRRTLRSLRGEAEADSPE